MTGERRQVRRLPWAVLLLWLLCAPLATAELLPVEVHINGQPRTPLFIERSPDGSLLLATDDLRDLGLLPDAAIPVLVDGTPYLALQSLDGISAKLDESTLTLQLTVRPDLLPASTLDFERGKPQRLQTPPGQSSFLNYALDLQQGSEDADRYTRLDSEVGARFGEVLFQSDGYLLSNSSENRAVRLNTSLTRENRTALTRWTAGDLFTRSATPAGTRQLGGIAFERRFAIDPYFITYPTLRYQGAVATASSIEVYLDGNRILQQSLPPGPFNLDNIKRYRGAGNLEIVLRDAYGREERIREPFYLSDRLLNRGLHDFSYAAGAGRESFGSESFDYGDLEVQAFHDYGWSDRLTAGAALEGSSGLLLLAPRMVRKISRQGLLEQEFGLSLGNRGTGLLLATGYSHETLHTGLEARLSYASRDFATLASRDSSDRQEWQLTLRGSYNTPAFGSVTLEGILLTDHILQEQQSLGLVYSRTLFANTSLVVSATGISGRNAETRALIGLNYQPRADMIMSLHSSTADSQQDLEAQVEKIRPVGEGGSYRVVLRDSEGDAGSGLLFNPLGEYRGRHAIYQAELNAASTDDGSPVALRLGASGALVYVGKHWGVTRPVSDSFSLVQVGELEGVEVLHNNRTLGQTDRHGQLFVPEMSSYYDNQISINDRAIPIDYTLAATRYLLTPDWRSGTCLYFAATSFRPLVGRLVAAEGETLLPLEYRELTLHLGDRSIVLPTGRGGEFYLDPQDPRLRRPERRLPPTDCTQLGAAGDSEKAVVYQASVEYNGTTYQLTLTPPPGSDFFADLGTIVVNRPRAAAGEAP